MRLRAFLLGVHVVGAVCWVMAIAVLLILESPAWSARVPDVLRAATVARPVMLLCAAVVLVTGLELARRYRAHWPPATAVQLISAAVVLGMTAALTLIDPSYWWPVRLGQITLLLSVFGLAVVTRPRPDDEHLPSWQPAPPGASRGTGGRHRK
jgi:hypothetical protein